MTTQRIERIIEEIIEEDMTPGDSPGELRRHLRSALTAFAEEQEKERQQLDASQILRDWAEGKRVVPDCLRRVPFMTMGLLADVFDELQRSPSTGEKPE